MAGDNAQHPQASATIQPSESESNGYQNRGSAETRMHCLLPKRF